MIAHDVEPDADQGTASLVSGILTDVHTLLSQHVTLLQQELQRNVQKLQKSVRSLIPAFLLAVMAGVTLSIAVALLLHDLVPGFPAWGCFAVVGLVWCGISAGLVTVGKRDLDSVQMVPESIQAVKEDVRCLTKN
jgi:hypothetical protein